MSAIRKEPRVNLRFKNFDLLDKLENNANSLGLTLPEYCRRSLLKSFDDSEKIMLLKRTQIECILTTQKLLEFSLPADQVAQAKAYTKDYLLKIASHAEQN